MIARSHATPHDREMRVWRSLLVLVLPSFVFASHALAQEADIPEEACQEVRIDLLPLTRGRGMGLRVTNIDPGDFTAHLLPTITVEQEVGGRWQRVGVAGLYLRERCDGSTPTSCVTLAPRASMVVVRWDGMLGDAQCDCTRCAPAPEGRYRFVIESCQCQHPHTTYSAAFALGPSTW